MKNMSIIDRGEIKVMKLNYKLWLEEDDEKLFGDGPGELLSRVERTGSLSQAAKEMQMSYSQAWHLLKDLEERLGFPLLEGQAGGSGGGGSQLTEKGKLLTEQFQSFRREAVSALESLEDKYFTEEFFDSLFDQE